MLLLLCVFLLKGFQSTKLKEYFFAFFNKGFIVSEIEERTSFFNIFSAFQLIFTTLIFALLGFVIVAFFTENTSLDVSFYGKTVLVTFSYFIFKWTLEYFFTVLFSIQTQIAFFLKSKKTYTHTLSLWLFPLLILYFYTALGKTALLLIMAFIFLIKFFLLITNNKNLILNKLFYFILYLCAFEIAPLFILFKFIF